MATAAGDVWVHYLRTLLRIQVGDRVLELRLVDREAAAACTGPWPFAAPVAVLTAWNPGSRPRESAANAAAQQALIGDLRGRGHRVLPAEGRATDSDWREPSVAVQAMDLNEAVALGRSYGQRALYWLGASGASVVGCTDAGRIEQRLWTSAWAHEGDRVDW